MQFDYAVLGTYQLGLDTLFADVLGYPSGQFQATPVPSQEPSLTALQTTYSMTTPSLLALPSPPASLPQAQSSDLLYVLDMNTGETVPSNVTLNTLGLSHTASFFVLRVDN